MINEMMHGPDYVQKLEKFSAEIERIKESYEGDFETYSPMYVMQHLPNNVLKFEVDNEVPEDLRAKLVEAFNKIWK